MLFVAKIYDKVGKVYLPPTYFKGLYDFVRAMSSEYDRDKNDINSNPMFLYPDDYRFIFDTIFDDESGEFKEVPALIFTVTDFLNALFINEEKTSRRSTDAVIAELELKHRVSLKDSVSEITSNLKGELQFTNICSNHLNS